MLAVEKVRIPAARDVTTKEAVTNTDITEETMGIESA